MYLPMVGLILIACEAAGRRWSNRLVPLITSAVLVFGLLCYQRNQLWAKPDRLWAMAALDSKKKGRPYWHLAESLIAENRCADAMPYLTLGEQLMPQDYSIEVAWGKVLECVGRREDALHRLERAAKIKPDSSVYQWIGLLCGEMGRTEQAGAALQEAVRLGPEDGAAHSALGLWYEALGNTAEAEREYRKSLSLDESNSEAQAGLGRVQRLGVGPGQSSP
jgi:Flp pilus assembly protein TadD